MAAWACYGQQPSTPAAAAAAAAGGPSGPSFSDANSGGGGGDSGGGGCSSQPGAAEEGAAAAAAVAAAAAESPGQDSLVYRPASELAVVVPLVRFMMMSKDDLKAVLSHPFVTSHPMVQQQIETDLAEAAAGAAASSTGYVFEGRGRIVRPSSAASGAANGSPAAAAPGGNPCSPPFAASPAAAAAGGADGAGPGPLSSPAAHHHDSPERSSPSSSHHHHHHHHHRSGQLPAPQPSCGLPGARYQRRLAPTCRELMYVYDGDQNGVISHIATDYGLKGWVNPVLAKRIEVRASSPASRFTDPKVRFAVGWSVDGCGHGFVEWEVISQSPRFSSLTPDAFTFDLTPPSSPPLPTAGRRERRLPAHLLCVPALRGRPALHLVAGGPGAVAQVGARSWSDTLLV